MWRDARVRCLTSETICVGIKQLQGRKGLTSGWRTDVEAQQWKDDPSLKKLEALVGLEYAERYSRLVGGQGTPAPRVTLL